MQGWALQSLSMRILVCGANGFIGRHLCEALATAGHEVMRGVRSGRTASDIAIDYTRDSRVEDWLPRLHNVDAVINAVGILCEKNGVTFDAVHRDTPVALFQACARAGVKRVVQISALGGGEGREPTPYMRTKREADACLMKSSLEWIILRPSLVVGIDGDSSRFFRTMASLPVIGLPGCGDQQLQPVHIDDLCQAVVRILTPGAPSRCTLDVVGPEPMTYREMLSAYRVSMGLPKPLWLPVPMALMRASASLAAKLPQRVFSPDTLRMLEDGNVGEARALAALLGRPPISAAGWFAGTAPDMLRWQAIANWSVPMFRVVLALVWIVTGLMSLGLYPVEDSLALLRQVGLQGPAAKGVLYGAALIDCAFGLATLLAPSRMLWRLQFVLILGYTCIITLFLPHFWLHPFGPVLKNLPILAILVVLDAAETR